MSLRLNWGPAVFMLMHTSLSYFVFGAPAIIGYNRHCETIMVTGSDRNPAFKADLAFRLWFPVGRSWWAVAAGYMGLFALYCVPVIGDMHQKLPGSVAAFVVLCLAAPLAIVLGAVAIADLRRKPELHGWGRAVFGLVMGSIFTSLLIGAIVSYAVGWSSQ
jgi:ABC-type dipeptide/oligopeptide/nickel transport system permease component